METKLVQGKGRCDGNSKKEKTHNKQGRVDNLRYQRSSHDAVGKTDFFHTCASADVSLDTETY